MYMHPDTTLRHLLSEHPECANGDKESIIEALKQMTLEQIADAIVCLLYVYEQEHSEVFSLECEIDQQHKQIADLQREASKLDAIVSDKLPDPAIVRQNIDNDRLVHWWIS